MGELSPWHRILPLQGEAAPSWTRERRSVSTTREQQLEAARAGMLGMATVTLAEGTRSPMGYRGLALEQLRGPKRIARADAVEPQQILQTQGNRLRCCIPVYAMIV